MRNRISTISIAALFAVLLASAPAAAQDRAPERTVTMTGQAELSMAPDQAWVTVGIEQRALKPQEAQRLAAEKMNRVRAQLTALGIPEGAIQTVSFSMDADW